ncbi:MAG: FapA family protein [bacterium]
MSSTKDGHVLIEISGNEMTANAFVMPPEGAGKPIKVVDVKKALREKGVVFGIVNDERMVVFLEEGKINPVEFLAAVGQAPGHGTDASVAYPWKTDAVAAMRDEKAQVDLRELNLVKAVSKGEVVAFKTLATRGDEGVTVTGKKTAGEWGSDVALKSGANVEVSADGSQFIAAAAGSPKLAGGVISVDPMYVVNGDVDYSTGNINFTGALEIKGNIHDGFIVKAEGNITIWGNVQACEVQSGGDVMVKGGIITRREGMVSAKGSVYAKFIENSIVEADTDVVVERAIINSSIHSNGMVICASKEGKIMGGDIMAFQEIRAKHLGTENETQTLLRAGYKYDTYLKLSESEQKLEKILLELNVIQKNISAMKPGQQEAILELKKRYSDFDSARLALQQQIASLRTRSQVNPFATVKGEEAIYPGCMIYIGSSKERVSKQLRFATLSSDREGGIALASYDEFSRTIKTVSVGTKEKKKTVLIVDDAKFMRNKLRNILENANFKIVGEAEDGAQAIQMYSKLNPDIVTMDITMPNIDGLAALREIKKATSDARVVMISALGQKDKVRDAIIAGAMDFVIKPFVPDRVIEVVTRVANK